MKSVTLCADDYGLNEAVSRAIIQLAERGRLSAVSCMSASPNWRGHAPWLSPLRGRIDIGLHLALTELGPTGSMPQLAPGGVFPALGKLLPAALMHHLPGREIAAELRRQMAAFVDEMGQPPDFIDGHQHVHLLPGIRETLFELWDEYLKPNGGYLRSCHEPLAAIVQRGVEPGKTLFISMLSTQMARHAGRVGALINDSFRGVHDFSGRRPPEELFPHFLRGGGERPLLMCHPGQPVVENGDILRHWRPREFAYLSSQRFQSDLEAAGISLGRFPRR